MNIVQKQYAKMEQEWDLVQQQIIDGAIFSDEHIGELEDNMVEAENHLRKWSYNHLLQNGLSLNEIRIMWIINRKQASKLALELRVN